MYATGIGLVLFGLQKAEEESALLNSLHEEKIRSKGHTDLFKDMPDSSQPAATSLEPEEETEPSKRKSKAKKHSPSSLTPFSKRTLTTNS